MFRRPFMLFYPHVCLIFYLITHVITSRLYEETLPPILLTVFHTTADIRYAHFKVQHACISSHLSLSIVFDKHCKPNSLIFFLRPGVLPVVRSSHQEIVKGIVLLPDTLHLAVHLNNATPVDVFGKGSTYTVQTNVLIRETNGLVDIYQISPVQATWFMGVYYLDNSKSVDCHVILYPRLSNEIIQTSLPVSVSYEQERNVNPSDPMARTHSRRQADHPSVFPFIHRTQSQKLRRTVDVEAGGTQSALTVSLPSSKGELFRLLVPEESAFIDLSIVSCTYSGPVFSANDSATSPNGCSSIILDVSRNQIPPTMSSIRTNRTRARPVISEDLSSPPTRFVVMNQTYRFTNLLGLSGSRYYLYVHNTNVNASIQITISLKASAGCPVTSPSNIPSSPEYRPHHWNNKYFSQLSLESTAIDSHESDTFSNGFVSPTSLLPWINPSWPLLTPFASQNNLDLDSSELVDPTMPIHQFLNHCSEWFALSRVSRTSAFSYHFTYQPDQGQYANAVRFPPWNVIIIPLNLDAGIDTGGTLEISLQLNAFDLTTPVNDTHSKPLPRQIILHGCFAPHRSLSASDFVDPKRCPMWFRLATNRGVTESIAGAVLVAASDALLKSQPPHRSELPPDMNVSYNESMDRSFMFIPYPPPGRWYLSLFAECYSTTESLCSQQSASSIDLGLIIRSSPCLNFRCRDVGEGASLPPSRLLDPDMAEPRPINDVASDTRIKQPWRPSWWSVIAKNNLTFTTDGFDDDPLPGEGLCVELLQNSIFASTCACPPGRMGLGCSPHQFNHNGSNTANDLQHQPFMDDLLYQWNGFSGDALWLSLSNLAFIPGIILAVRRRLWIPVIVYSYTLIFSSLYHLCDTDVMSAVMRLGVRTISGDAMSFGGYALPKVKNYRLSINRPIGYRTTSNGFRFTSNVCLLPFDVLSYCDFLGGTLSLWVTIITACACPLRYAQMSYIAFVLSVSVALQVARFSVWLYVTPCVIGGFLIMYSWVLRSRQTGHLFPPIQWWLLSLIPGLIFAVSGLFVFLSPNMIGNYTRLHSLWHVLIACSLTGLLPWPAKWRTALASVVSRDVPLSCGGTVSKIVRSNRLHNRRLLKTSTSAICTSEFLNKNLKCYKPYSYLKSITSKISSKLDRFIELNFILDTLVNRWSKMKWVLPHGYGKCDLTTDHHGQSDHFTTAPIEELHIAALGDPSITASPVHA